MWTDLLDLVERLRAPSAWMPLAGAVALFIVLRIAVATAVRRLARRRDEGAAASTYLIDGLRSVKSPVLGAIAFAAGLGFAALPAGVERVRIVVLVLALVIQGAFTGQVIVDAWVSAYVRRRSAENAAAATTVRFAGFIARLLVWTAAALLALDNLGFDITALVAGLGVGGIAVALAVQSVLGDLFASMSIVLDQPFVLGDFITVGDMAGKVEHIGLKTTRLRSLSGEQLVFSNSDLLNSRVRNFKRMVERRVLFSVGVTYDTPHETVAALPGLLRRIIEAQPGVRFDRAHFQRFGPSSLDFEAVYFVASPEYNAFMDTQQAINLDILKQFGELGVEFAYPTQTIHLSGAATPPPAAG